jgi:eukaryotic-like serine/threonine-protein kinase
MSPPTVNADADTLAAGSRVGAVVGGKYRLERLLGHGGMGEVYEARHVVVGRRFAVKLLHAHLATTSSANTRFLREARAAGSLESEHIAAVVDLGTADDETPFLVMEHLSGSSLARLCATDGPLAVPRAASLLLQACRGLEAAHQAGIVHRDLKPDNLFVVKRDDGSELLKILDFGIAKLAGEQNPGLTHSGAVLGTPFYMAPEQARGDKSVDFRVDIHALGVIGYELLTGQRPHPGDGYNAILAHILTQPIVPLSSLRPGLPNALVKLIEQALAFEPAARPSSAAALAKQLMPFVTREVTGLESQFDLRPVARVPGAVTGADVDAGAILDPGSTGSTLESATRELDARASTSSERPRARVLLSAAALAAALALVLSQLAGRAPHAPEASQPTAAGSQSSPVVTREASQNPALASAAGSPPTLSASATPSATPPLARGNPRPRSAKAAASAHEVTFDDKNPY